MWEPSAAGLRSCRGLASSSGGGGGGQRAALRTKRPRREGRRGGLPLGNSGAGGPLGRLPPPSVRAGPPGRSPGADSKAGPRRARAAPEEKQAGDPPGEAHTRRLGHALPAACLPACVCRGLFPPPHPPSPAAASSPAGRGEARPLRRAAAAGRDSSRAAPQGKGATRRGVGGRRRKAAGPFLALPARRSQAAAAPRCSRPGSARGSWPCRGPRASHLAISLSQLKAHFLLRNRRPSFPSWRVWE